MSKEVKNLPLSIQHKIRNIAKAKGEGAEALLYRYVVERFLYRLSISEYKDKFYLKGAFLFTIWEGTPHRATRDIDFLGHVSDHIDVLENILRKVSSIPYEKDGLIFDLESIKGEAIREGQSYGGIRLKQNVKLGKARVILQIDVGFGDAVTPKAEEKEFPSLLGMDAVKIKTYPMYTVIAEKLEAMVSLDIDNSRMKDFYDVWFLVKKFEMDPNKLDNAIKNTFARRGTLLPSEMPTALTERFYGDDNKNIQWNAFIRRNSLASEELTLKDVTISLSKFFRPFFTE